jgi:hypothetical protein
MVTHPDLKPALRRIYRATLHPDVQLETRLDEVEEHEEDADALARRWGPDMRRWTRDKADERALGLLVELQMRDEGVAEFAELVNSLLGASKTDEGSSQEHVSQDAMLGI